jgi:hypothetical protein
MPPLMQFVANQLANADSHISGCESGKPRLIAPHRAPVAQLDRASDYESEGRAFESLRVHHFPLSYLVICPRWGKSLFLYR